MTWPHTPLPGFVDRVYKTTSSGDLRLRIFPATTTRAGTDDALPWALHFHGGGFVFGTATAPLQWLVKGFNDRDYHVVSVAYRFAPHVTYHDILQDCNDAYEWCRANLAQIVPVDLDRCVFTGDSAGGNLALTTAQRTAHRPRAVLDIYGLCDWTVPTQFPKSEPPVDETIITEQEILETLRAPQEHLALSWCPFAPEATDAEFAARHAVDTPVPRAHFELARYMLTRHLAWRALFRAKDEDLVEVLRKNSVINHIDSSFPPTIIVHGTADKAVDVAQSKSLAERLRSEGVPVVEFYIEGADHVMDADWTDGASDYPARIMDCLDKWI